MLCVRGLYIWCLGTGFASVGTSSASRAWSAIQEWTKSRQKKQAEATHVIQREWKHFVKAEEDRKFREKKLLEQVQDKERELEESVPQPFCVPEAGIPAILRTTKAFGCGMCLNAHAYPPRRSVAVCVSTHMHIQAVS